MSYFVIVVSLALIALGALTVGKAEQVGAAVSRFYSNYPLVQLAGPRQMRLRKSFMVIVGVVFIVVGVIGLMAVAF